MVDEIAKAPACQSRSSPTDAGIPHLEQLQKSLGTPITRPKAYLDRVKRNESNSDNCDESGPKGETRRAPARCLSRRE